MSEMAPNIHIYKAEWRYLLDCISVVLGCDMAFTCAQIQGWDVVSTISVLELDRLCTSSKSKQLVTHAYSHDGQLGLGNQLAKVVDCFLTMCWVTGTIGYEHAVEMSTYS